MEHSILAEAVLPPGTEPEVAEEAAELLRSALAAEAELTDPEVSVSAERASATLSLILDAIVTHGPQVVTVAAGATTVIKAIEAAKALWNSSKAESLTPAQRLIAELPIESIKVQRPDGTLIPITELMGEP